MKHDEKVQQKHFPKTLGGLVDSAYKQAYRQYGDSEMAVMIATVVANEAILNGLNTHNRRFAA